MRYSRPGMAITTTAKRPLGELLREARETAGLNKRQLAERIAPAPRGTSAWHREVDTLHRSLRRWERGDNKPGWFVVTAIARETGTPLEFFMSGDGEELP